MRSTPESCPEDCNRFFTVAGRTYVTMLFYSRDGRITGRREGDPRAPAGRDLPLGAVPLVRRDILDRPLLMRFPLQHKRRTFINCKLFPIDVKNSRFARHNMTYPEKYKINGQLSFQRNVKDGSSRLQRRSCQNYAFSERPVKIYSVSQATIWG